MTDYPRLRSALRFWMLGKGYYMASKAMDFGLKRHTGLRKDGITPEFAHQVEIAQYVRTLCPSLLFPEETLATVFLHDTFEDTPDVRAEVKLKFGEKVYNAVDMMTKFRFPNKLHEKSKEYYYGVMAECPITSIAKPADRGHNQGSIIGVFTEEKQFTMLQETEDFILPMMKEARRNFPEQEAAYQNAKHILLMQAKLIRSHLGVNS